MWLSGSASTAWTVAGGGANGADPRVQEGAQEGAQERERDHEHGAPARE